MAPCNTERPASPLPLATTEILDALPDNVIVQDRNHTVLWVNRTTRESGPSGEEYPGHRCHRIWHSRDVPCDNCPCEEALATGQTAHRVSVTPDGNHWEVRAVPVQASSGNPEIAIKMVRNITARVHAEQTRDRLFRELGRKNEELERFADVVSHDLRSPLTTIGGFADLLRRQLTGGDSDNAGEFLKRIHDAARQMEEMIEGLLELGRAGRPIGEPERVSLAALAASAALMVEGDAVRRGVEVTVSPDLPEVLGDGARLTQVFLNLLSNGIRHGADGSPPVVRVSGTPGNDGTVVCTVEDSGPGVPEDKREAIFTPFEQGQGGGKSGLGLSIVRRIVEAHGGEVAVAPPGEPGGCTIRFSLPTAA